MANVKPNEKPQIKMFAKYLPAMRIECQHGQVKEEEQERERERQRRTERERERQREGKEREGYCSKCPKVVTRNAMLKCN